MGKLNIAHHKSYHPYRRDNIERVRRDEEEARLKEEKEEGRLMLADSEARIDLLRERAGVKAAPKRKKRDDDDLEKAMAIRTQNVETGAVLPTTNGHINFFEDLEQSSIAASIRTATKKKGEATETDRGVPLAPSAKDLNPWYIEPAKKGEDDDDEVVDEKRMRDALRKSAHDPLTSITHQLASRHGSTSTSSRSSYKPRPQPKSGPPEVQERLSRESSERERALALIRRKQREMRGSETPSTVHGGYNDMFNRQEVEEAHRGRFPDYRRTRW
ncbi:hypothetical protein MIND_01363900 [Mycena indigotica]|uniref:CBF1-interacting co-repressor CIR N-terminal domain-containing protein n=1 Tax=Mycena indigotica TaxID=2126181 RepID=A0A8H6VQ23_9AGAR|nr:uncharacterized protein MIND_01363900 [Mycena indigotica]KAF7289892.1 hypothetical protein MIND_01363900 [Mycena indigotica]